MITSAALTDIFCASSPTLIVSGMRTSRTTGAVGRSKACWPAVLACTRCGRRDTRVLRRALRPSATCSSSRRRGPLRSAGPGRWPGALAPGLAASPGGGGTGSSGTGAGSGGAGAAGSGGAASAAAASALASAASGVCLTTGEPTGGRSSRGGAGIGSGGAAGSSGTTSAGSSAGS